MLNNLPANRVVQLMVFLNITLLLGCERPAKPLPSIEQPPIDLGHELHQWLNGQPVTKTTVFPVDQLQSYSQQSTFTLFPVPKSHEHLPGLHQVFQLGPTLYSGNSPEGDTGFDSLKKLGIRYIVSVDGAVPDISRANRRGMNYLHLPIGYDDVDRRCQSAISLLLLATNRPDFTAAVYVHCHHGKHRGPAAVMTSVRCINRECHANQAMAFLKQAGTDPKYRGLYDSVATQQLLAIDPNLSLHHLPMNVANKGNSTVQIMVDIDTRWDRIKALQANGWKRIAGENHDPKQDLIILAELYREMGRTGPKVFQREPVKNLIVQTEETLTELANQIGTTETAKANALFSVIQQNCVKCHQLTRDHRELID